MTRQVTSNHAADLTVCPSDSTQTTRNVIIPMSAAHYHSVQEIVRSGYDPEVTQRMQQEALKLLYSIQE